MKHIPIIILAAALLSGCSRPPKQVQFEIHSDNQWTDFVEVTDREGAVWVFRPQYVRAIQPIWDEKADTNKCQIVIEGMPRILMNCSSDEAAKLVRAK
jgi:hypothetical protein